MTEKLTPLDLIIKAERASASAAETFRYVADYEGGSVDAKDAQDIVQQSQIFVSALRLILITQ